MTHTVNTAPITPNGKNIYSGVTSVAASLLESNKATNSLGVGIQTGVQVQKAPTFLSAILTQNNAAHATLTQEQNGQSGDAYQAHFNILGLNTQTIFHAPQVVASPVGQEDVITSEEVLLASKLNTPIEQNVKEGIDTNTTSSSTTAEATGQPELDNSKEATLSKSLQPKDLPETLFVSINSNGEIEWKDETGQVLDLPFGAALEKNPLIQDLISKHIETGEEISINRNVIASILQEASQTQIDVQNDIELALEKNIQPQDKGNSQNVSQSPTSLKTAQQLASGNQASPPQNVVQQTPSNAVTASTVNAFDLDSYSESSFGDDFNGQTDSTLNTEWNQVQGQKQASGQNFASHLSQAKPTATPVAEQIALQLQKGVNGQIDKITVQLNPKELGKVTIDFDFSDDHHAKTTIVADKADTLELLKQDAKTLQKILQDAGLETGNNSLEFSLGGQQDNTQNQQKTAKKSHIEVEGFEHLTSNQNVLVASNGLVISDRVNIII